MSLGSLGPGVAQCCRRWSTTHRLDLQGRCPGSGTGLRHKAGPSCGLHMPGPSLFSLERHLDPCTCPHLSQASPTPTCALATECPTEVVQNTPVQMGGPRTQGLRPCEGARFQPRHTPHLLISSTLMAFLEPHSLRAGEPQVTSSSQTLAINFLFPDGWPLVLLALGGSPWTVLAGQETSDFCCPFVEAASLANQQP